MVVEGASSSGSGSHSGAPDSREVTKVAADALLLKQRKELRKKKATETAERKRKQDQRISEEQGKKQARDQVTLRSFYTTSRNSENRGPLDLHDPLKSKPPLTGSKKKGSTRPHRVQLPPYASSDLASASSHHNGLSVETSSANVSEGPTKQDSCFILSSKPPIPVVCISNDSLPHVCSEDDPDFHAVHGPPEDSDISGDDMEEEEQLEPLIRFGKPNYDLTRKFQMECFQQWVSEADHYRYGVLA